jgi:hypothetical protein
MHHGVGGNFYGSPLFAQAEEYLAQAGCAVLRVNNRGHDIAYNTARGRLGAAFETVDDCRLDWRAWIEFAVSSGFRRLGLWGHSLGALKTVYYLATEEEANVVCAVATSPPRFSYSDYVSKEGSERFLVLHDRALGAVEAGEPDAIFAASVPTNVLLTARTYIDKYGREERYDLLRHLPNVRVPVLVTIGGLEGLGPEAADWFPFGGLAEKVADLAGRSGSLSFRLIEGANHAYAGRLEDLWRVVRPWLERPAVPARA